MAEATWGDLMSRAQVASEPVAEGEHSVKIVDAEATRASTGSLMFKYKAEIIDGPDVKRKIYGNLVVSPDNGTALAIFFRNMESLGLDANFFAANPNPDQVAGAMLNRQARVQVKHKEWQGVKRGEIVRWLGAPGEGGLGLGPIAPGTVTGPAGPPLPTSATPASPAASALPTATTKATTPMDINPATIGGVTGAVAGPIAPTDAPHALPI